MEKYKCVITFLQLQLNAVGPAAIFATEIFTLVHLSPRTLAIDK